MCVTRMCLVVVSLAAWLLGVAGCGSEPLPSGTVVGSSDDAHLTKAEFDNVVEKATREAGAVHTVRKEAAEGDRVTLTADVSWFNGVPSARVTVPVYNSDFPSGSQAATAELRLLGTRFYVYSPGAIPVGKFVAGDTRRDPATIAGVCVCLVTRLQPQAMLSHLHQSLLGVDFIGLDSDDGQYLEHYRVTADARKIPDATDIDTNPLRVYDMWLDSQHLIRRYTYRTATTSVDVTYSRWGKRVDVDQPAAKQVLNASSTNS